MPSSPIAAEKLAVSEGNGGGFRVFEPTIQPVQPKELKEMRACYPVRSNPFREKIRGEPVANATRDAVPTLVEWGFE